MKKNVKSTQSILFFFFLIFIARDVGGVHENVYNLNILLLKLKYAFRKICMIDDKKKVNSHSIHILLNYPSNNTENF